MRQIDTTQSRGPLRKTFSNGLLAIDSKPHARYALSKRNEIPLGDTNSLIRDVAQRSNDSNYADSMTVARFTRSGKMLLLNQKTRTRNAETFAPGSKGAGLIQPR